MAVPQDLSDSPCPSAANPISLRCRGSAVCLGPGNEHAICNGFYWKHGNCPWALSGKWGPPAGVRCTDADNCSESFGEAQWQCKCLPSGVAKCCMNLEPCTFDVDGGG